MEEGIKQKDIQILQPARARICETDFQSEWSTGGTTNTNNPTSSHSELPKALEVGVHSPMGKKVYI